MVGRWVLVDLGLKGVVVVMPAEDVPQRPALDSTLTGAEFSRWYWLKTELAGFARSHALVTTGSKEQLALRVEAFLDGRQQPARPAAKRTATRQLSGPVAADTAIPAGQRCSQLLRVWFEQQLGPGFTFDTHMREYFAAADGTTTLADALSCWHTTRNAPASQIGRQFELNLFTRAWFAGNPGGTREQMHTAWQLQRALPKDLRP